MSGNSEGAKKAAQTTRDRHGGDFFSKIGKDSWKDPERSREVGFAVLDKQTHKEVSTRGGKKTKEDYKEKTSVDPETKDVGSGVSE